jgi:thymidylate synthase ThyX
MNNIEIIADSKNKHGQRIITAVATFPRYLLAEVNTHRALTRSSASSRAIRFEKMVESVQNNPFIPQKWQKDHPGMQGTEYFEDVSEIAGFQYAWLKARDLAVEQAKELHLSGVTKQICNRLLEPFMYHTALITATEFENFFALRADDMAEIHLQDVAYKFLEAVNASEPKQLKAGEWHIPFGDDFDEKELSKVSFRTYNQQLQVGGGMLAKLKISTVRCARISYKVPGTEQKIDYAADLALHDRLASSGHWSAFEHCARAMSSDEYDTYVSGRLVEVERTAEGEWYTALEPTDDGLGWCGNFKGFIQYRKMFSGENRKDSRLIQK